MNIEKDRDFFRGKYKKFITKRCNKLSKEPVYRRAKIIDCMVDNEFEDIENRYFQIISESIIDFHLHHNNIDPKTGKTVSIGVIRMANVPPCIDLTKFLLRNDFGNDFEIRTMAYHSSQVLLMRNEQEKYLDKVLNRKNGAESIFSDNIIRKHINEIDAKNIIFVLVVTSIEEVGRDHCFDWGIIEPSSFRSIIQLSGRVIRHIQNKYTNEKCLNYPNIGILQYNLKGLKIDGKLSFNKPGFESSEHILESHDMYDLVNIEEISKKIDSIPRIMKNETDFNPNKNLIDLEHECLHELLTNYDQQGANTLEGWNQGFWWVTGLPQAIVRFRYNNEEERILYLLPENDDNFDFYEKGANDQGEPVKNPIRNTLGINVEDLSENEIKRLWIYRDYKKLFEENVQNYTESFFPFCAEIKIIVYKNIKEYRYIDQLGLTRIKMDKMY
jgi:CRISPR-associated endonuclease/helicase Cas3